MCIRRFDADDTQFYIIPNDLQARAAGIQLIFIVNSLNSLLLVFFTFFGCERQPPEK